MCVKNIIESSKKSYMQINLQSLWESPRGTSSFTFHCTQWFLVQKANHHDELRKRSDQIKVGLGPQELKPYFKRSFHRVFCFLRKNVSHLSSHLSNHIALPLGERDLWIFWSLIPNSAPIHSKSHITWSTVKQSLEISMIILRWQIYNPLLKLLNFLPVNWIL